MSQESEQTVETGATPAAQETASPAETEGGSTSDPAGSQDGQSLRDVVATALMEAPEGGTAAATPDDTQAAAPEPARNPAPEQAPADAGEDQEFRIPDEDFKKLPKGVQSRIGHLAANLSKARKERDDLTGRLQAVEPAAKNGQDLERFVVENRIDPANLSKAFGMMAKLSNGDFQGFLADIQPFVALAQQSSGVAVAQDLKSAVENGDMSEEQAKLFTKERAENARLKSERDALERRQSAMSGQQAAQAGIQAIAAAVSAREQELRRADPDFARIAPMVERQIAAMIESGARPKTAQEGEALLNRAVDLVKQLAPAAPAPKATQPVPSATATPRGQTPQARNAREAVAAAFGL